MWCRSLLSAFAPQCHNADQQIKVQVVKLLPDENPTVLQIGHAEVDGKLLA
jgi:hypothetical protein